MKKNLVSTVLFSVSVVLWVVVICAGIAAYMGPSCPEENIVVSGGMKVTVSDGINEFAVKMYKELSKENPDGNLFFSPYSIYTALGMTYAGATGETKDEFEQLLGIKGKINDKEFHASLDAISAHFLTKADLQQLQKQGSESLDLGAYQFSLANAIWLKSGFSVEKPYACTVGVIITLRQETGCPSMLLIPGWLIGLLVKSQIFCNQMTLIKIQSVY